MPNIDIDFDVVFDVEVGVEDDPTLTEMSPDLVKISVYNPLYVAS